MYVLGVLGPLKRNSIRIIYLFSVEMKGIECDLLVFSGKCPR